MHFVIYFVIDYISRQNIVASDSAGQCVVNSTADVLASIGLKCQRIETFIQNIDPETFIQNHNYYSFV
jgi:hypothetical protein